MKFSHLRRIQSLAVVGATDLVGQEFLELLSEHKIKSRASSCSHRRVPPKRT